MIEIRFLGGCGEVGKMGILIDTGVEKFVWEYGTNVQTKENPLEAPPNLDGLFVSHAHLDHSGLVPKLYRTGYSGPFYCNPVTADIMDILLRDSIKLQRRAGEPLEFRTRDVKKMANNTRFLRPGDVQDFTVSSVSFHNAGHVPGSSMLLLKSRDKKILFTGDVKFIDTQLMEGAETDFSGIDLLISESTYSYTDHPDRKMLEESLRKIVLETTGRGGICVIPAFAVGRTQEILMILEDLDVPVYVDGMGISVTEAVIKHPKSVRDHGKLERAFSKARKVMRQKDRERALEKPCVIVTTAGMLNGGPVVYYISRLFDREDCSLVMTGFQVPGTAGRTLLDTGEFTNEEAEISVKPKMKMEFLDFSAHADRSHLIDFYRKVKPKKIALVHGEKTGEFAEDLMKMGFDAFDPEEGESLELE